VDGPEWHDITPRLGLAYDLFGDGRTALKATVGKYLEGVALGSGNTTRWNPVGTSVNQANRDFTDRNGDFIPDCDFSNPLPNGECGRLSNLNFGQRNPLATQFDPAVFNGWGTRRYSWETSASIRHELLTGLAVNAGYFRRWYGNWTAQDNLEVEPSDFDPFCLMLPSDQRLPGGGSELCGFYHISQAKFGRSQNLVTFASNYGDGQTEIYNGVDLTVNARLRNGAQFTGGVTIGRKTLDSCYVIDSPATSIPSTLGDLSSTDPAPTGAESGEWNANFCDYKQPFRGIYKVLGMYPLPWGVQVSATYATTPGPEITAEYTATNAEIAPSLGRNLSSGPNGTLTLPIIKPGTMYGSRTTTFNTRFSKLLRIGGTRVMANLDVFNVLNLAGVQELNPAYGPNWLQPLQVQGGRLFQLSGQIDF
jgi:hypothetical protein